MSYDYEALYRDTPDALGEASAIVMKQFDSLEGHPLRVLDIGCGQGRDALPLARRGFHVVGVDWAPSGVRDMCNAARQEGLSIEGIVADIRAYQPEGLFDVLLIDRTLHMLEPPEQTKVLSLLLKHCAEGARLLISDERKNFPRFVAVMENDEAAWRITRNSKGQLFATRQ